MSADTFLKERQSLYETIERLEAELAAANALIDVVADDLGEDYIDVLMSELNVPG